MGLTEEEKKIRRRAACRKYYYKTREERLIKMRNGIKDAYAANPEKFKKRSREYFSNCKKTYLNNKDARKKPFITATKARAKLKNIPFEITEDDIYLPTHCPLLGTELDYAMGKGYRPNQASLDRKIPHLGYVPGNVWIVSRKANTMKSNASLEELQTFVANLKRLGMIT